MILEKQKHHQMKSFFKGNTPKKWIHLFVLKEANLLRHPK